MTKQAFTITRNQDYLSNSIADGYVYECSCGELYREVAHAFSCRKCRHYCVFGWCTHVVDIRTNEVVAGEEPSAEEYEVACAQAEAKWAEEKAEYEFQTQMWMQEGELYEAEMQRQRDAEILRKLELHVDQMYMIQDRLSGVA